MEELTHKLHELVLFKVRQRWKNIRHKSFMRWLLELGELKPLAIIIQQTDKFHQKPRMCSGNIINQWMYDDTGLQFLTNGIIDSEMRFDYCHFCIDKEERKLVIDWATIFPAESTRKKLHYHHHGEAYEIIKTDGIDDFVLVSYWIE